MKKTVLLLTALTFVISSCTLEKRRYTGGYSVDWHKQIVKTKQENKPIKESPAITASISSVPEIVKSPKPYILTDTNNCDEITLLDGTLVKGKVEKIGVDVIEYRECDNSDSPLIDIDKSTVFTIRYANGKRTVINSANTQKDNEDNLYNQTAQENASQQAAIVAQQQNTAAQNANNNQNNGSNNACIRILGIVFLVLGFVLLFFVSILLGIILLILGLIFVII